MKLLVGTRASRSARGSLVGAAGSGAFARLGALSILAALACGGPRSEPATPPHQPAHALEAPARNAALPSGRAEPSVQGSRVGAPPCAGGRRPAPDGRCSELPLEPAAARGASPETEPDRALVAGSERLARGTQTPADQALRRGDRAYQQEDYKSARAHYQRARHLAPKDPAPRVGLVRIELIESGIPTGYAAAPGHARLQRLLAELGSALKLDENYAPALIEQGRVLLILGKAEPALNALERGVSHAPTNAEAHSALGVALLATGDPAEAVQRFERAAELEPANAERLTNLGTAYMMRGRVEEAIRAYRKAVMLAPADARAQGDLGTALLAQHRVGQALPYLQRAVQLAPDRATFLSNLGYAYQLSGRVDDAIATYRKALAKDAKLGSAWINLGTALAEQKKYQEAEQALRQALALDPSDPRAKANLEELKAVQRGALKP